MWSCIKECLSSIADQMGAIALGLVIGCIVGGLLTGPGAAGIIVPCIGISVGAEVVGAIIACVTEC